MKIFGRKHKHFKTIEDCPIWNLNKVNETADIRYLLKLDDYFDELPSSGYDLKTLVETYQKIHEQVINHFGFDEKFIGKMRAKKDLLILHLKVLSGEGHLKAILKVKQKTREENAPKMEGKKQDFEEQIVMMERHFQVSLNVQTLSVKKFYTYLNLFKKDNQIR